MDKHISKIGKLHGVAIRKYLQKLSFKTVIDIKEYVDNIYYNTGEDTGLTDEQYDTLKEYILTVDPKYGKVGHKLRDDDNKIVLPVWMGSMNKVKKTDQKFIDKWLTTYHSSKYVVEAKLDGVSCLLLSNSDIKLYTRGDGEVGSDISYLVKYFNLPNLDTLNTILGDKWAIRGELIMSKTNFEKHSSTYKNARNLVSGVVNSKTYKPATTDVDFVAYEVLSLDGEEPAKPTEQLKWMESLGFIVVKSSVLPKKSINTDVLETTLLTFKETYDYEMDGIIVQPDNTYTRNETGNPDYAFAFKVNIDIQETTVKDVIWTISKWGYLKPRINFEEIYAGGADLNYATGDNAAYIEDNNIGPGKKIYVMRSGDVIPKITDVLQNDNIKAKMPSIKYVWNKTHIDISPKDITPYIKDMCIKRSDSFFSDLKIKYVSEATIRKIYNQGDVNNLLELIEASSDVLQNVDTIKKTLADKIVKNIKDGLQDIEIYDLLGASGIFGEGLGSKKLKILFTEYPDILEKYKTYKPQVLYKMIDNLEGFSTITTYKILENLKYAKALLKRLRPNISLKVKEKITDELKGMKFVWTGFTDKSLKEIIESKGGSMVSSVSSKTTALIVKNKGSGSGKEKKAEDLGIPIYTKDEFIKTYLE